MRICEQVWVLHHGELIAAGSPEQIGNHPRVREVYLGV
jgi:branched-chain amino acid transport system ATP-binding protein